VRWSLVIGAVVLTVVAIVISAAFAVGARRQLVTLGQLSASGAPATTVRAALVLQGTVTGVVGALGGIFLAAAVLLRFEGTVEHILDQRIDGYVVPVVELLVVAAIGVAAATAAALIPARTAARIPTLAALAGRRPLPPVSRRLVTWGVGGMVGGLGLLFLAVLGSQSGSEGDVWAFVAIVGGVAELLGACAISPAIVARLEPMSARLRGALRLGARSLARHRARTGAVVSAVAAAAALAVVSGALLLAAEQQSQEDGGLPEDVVVVSAFPFDPFADPDAGVPADLRAEVLDLLPGAREVSAKATEFMPPGPTGSGLWDAAPADRRIDAFVGASSERALLATDDLLEAIDAPRAVRGGLAEHGLVVLSTMGGGGYEGEATIFLPDGREVPGLSVRHDHVPAYESSYLITEDLAEELELETSESVIVIEAPEPLTAEQRGVLDDLRWDLESGVVGPAEAHDAYNDVRWEEPRSGPTPFQVELILTGVALVFSLFVVGVSLALAAAESKDERDILTIAGAPPGALARSAGARAWLLSIIGTVMAVPVGFLPIVVTSWATAQNDEADGYPIVFPTRTVALLVIALPLAVCLVSWASSATAQRLRPVRISTATFE
jgi:putative ABC transport system permease protein